MQKISVVILFILFFSAIYCQRLPAIVSIKQKSKIVLTDSSMVTLAGSFEELLTLQGIDKSGKKDGLIRYGEIKEIESLYLKGTQLTSIEGIAYFTNLRSLTLDFTGVDSLDLSRNEKLEFLHCESGPERSSVSPKISYLNVRNCKALKHVAIHENFHKPLKTKEKGGN